MDTVTAASGSPDEVESTRPCAHCGRPVVQRVGAGRPFRYCRDNDGQCQRASRNGRMRHRNAPGLTGQVARTWEVVERLDLLVETLSEALHAELSPVGVERQLAEVRAEAAAHIALAQTERDEARRAGEAATAALSVARQETAAATRDRTAAESHLSTAHAAVAGAEQAARRAAADRDTAAQAATAAEALRRQAEQDRDSARAEIRTLRGQRDEARTGLAEASRERDAARADAERAARAAQEALTQSERFRSEAEAAREQALHARRDSEAARREAEAARIEAATAQSDTRQAQNVGQDLSDRLRVTATEADRLRQEVVSLRARADAAEAAQRDNAELTTLIGAAETERDAALSRAAELSRQVSDLASALARLGPVGGSGR